MDSRHLNLAGDPQCIDLGNTTFPFLTDSDGLLLFPDELSQELEGLLTFPGDLEQISPTYSLFHEHQDRRYPTALPDDLNLDIVLPAHDWSKSSQLPLLDDFQISLSLDTGLICDMNFDKMKIDSVMDSFLSASHSPGSGMALISNGQSVTTDNSSGPTSSVSSDAIPPSNLIPKPYPKPSHGIAASQAQPPTSNFGLSISPMTPASSSGSSAYTRPPPSIPCPVSSCKRVFSLQHELNRHLKSHTHPSQCPQCGHGFETAKDVKRHINDVHDRTKRFFCSVSDCRFSRFAGEGKGFARKENWKRHMRSKHAELGEMG